MKGDHAESVSPPVEMIAMRFWPTNVSAAVNEAVPPLNVTVSGAKVIVGCSATGISLEEKSLLRRLSYSS